MSVKVQVIFYSMYGHIYTMAEAIAAGAWTGMPIPLVALGAAAVLLLGRVRSETVYRQIDWSLLVMFTGLFVVVHAFEVKVIQQWASSAGTFFFTTP